MTMSGGTICEWDRARSPVLKCSVRCGFFGSAEMKVVLLVRFRWQGPGGYHDSDEGKCWQRLTGFFVWRCLWWICWRYSSGGRGTGGNIMVLKVEGPGGAGKWCEDLSLWWIITVGCNGGFMGGSKTSRGFALALLSIPLKKPALPPLSR